MSSPHRPWQGTLLGFFYSMGFIGLGAAVSMILLSKFGSYQNESFASATTLMTVGLGILFIFQFFVARGVLKGQKWAIGITMLYSAVGLILTLMNFPQGAVMTIFYAFMLYIGFVCWKHPYYNTSINEPKT